MVRCWIAAVVYQNSEDGGEKTEKQEVEKIRNAEGGMKWQGVKRGG